MKIEFIENTPNLIPEDYKEENLLFEWYEKNKKKEVRSCVKFNWVTPKPVINLLEKRKPKSCHFNKGDDANNCSEYFLVGSDCNNCRIYP